MLILAIDSSGMTASAALASEERVIAEMSVNNRKTHSQTLLPMIKTVVDSAGIELAQIDAIAIAQGPGSFTGLRIGAALAKGLGLSLERPLIGVPTMDAMAYGAGMTDALICPMIDARHETVYTGLYQWKENRFSVTVPTEAVHLKELAAQIAEHAGEGQNVHILGDGADVYAQKFDGYLEETVQKAERANAAQVPAVTVLPVHLNRQRAASVAALALEYAKDGKLTPADDFKPEYYRLTQAERERLKKEQS